MGLSTHGVSGDGCVDNHDCFPHVYPHVFHSFQGVIHMLTGGMGIAGVEGVWAVIRGFILYEGLIWGMWGAQGVYMAG